MKKKIIPQATMRAAQKLSAEWNNTAFLYVGADGPMGLIHAVAWNNYRFWSEKNKADRPIIAMVDGTKGWVIEDESYEWEMTPVALNAPLINFDEPVNLRLKLLFPLSDATKTYLAENKITYELENGPKGKMIILHAVTIQQATEWVRAVNG